MLGVRVVTMIKYSDIKDAKLFLQYRSRISRRLAEDAKLTEDYKYNPWFKRLVDSVLDFEDIDYDA